MLEQITAVLENYRDYWPIIPRQVLYRLMGRGAATKDDAGRIGEFLVRGRRAQLIPWEAIGDNRTESLIPIVCDDPEAFRAEMRASASVYALDRQRGQQVYLEVFVEAHGGVEQVAGIVGATTYGIPVYSGSGYNTVTALREIVLRAEQREVPTLVLILGDFDPHGEFIRQRAADDVAAFAEHHPGVEVDVQTVALTETQIDALGLIKQPMDTKKRSKYPRWPYEFTVEFEALAPDDLDRILRATVDELTDPVARQAVLNEEREQRVALMAELEGGTTA
jgi:hypothetical protein